MPEEIRVIMENGQDTSNVFMIIQSLVVPILSLVVAWAAIKNNKRMVEMNLENNKNQEIFSTKKEIYIRSLRLMNEAVYDDQKYMDEEYTSEICAIIAELQIIANDKIIFLYYHFISIISEASAICFNRIMESFEKIEEENRKSISDVSKNLSSLFEDYKKIDTEKYKINDDKSFKDGNEIVKNYESIKAYIENKYSQMNKGAKEKVDEELEKKLNDLMYDCTAECHPLEGLDEIVSEIALEMKKNLK
jgi:hypothetical protein